MDKKSTQQHKPKNDEKTETQTQVKLAGWPEKQLNTLYGTRKLARKNDGGNAKEPENRPGKRSYAQRSKRKDQKDAAYPRLGQKPSMKSLGGSQQRSKQK